MARCNCNIAYVRIPCRMRGYGENHIVCTEVMRFIFEPQYFVIYSSMHGAFHCKFEEFRARTGYLRYTVFTVISALALISAPAHISQRIELIPLNMLVFKSNFYHVSLLRYCRFKICRWEINHQNFKQAYFRNEKWQKIDLKTDKLKNYANYD